MLDSTNPTLPIIPDVNNMLITDNNSKPGGAGGERC